jgi:AcrR family transcriptional regulator
MTSPRANLVTINRKRRPSSSKFAITSGKPKKIEIARNPSGTPKLTETFESLQSKLLAEQSKSGQRAPGRARIDRIIGTTIELLREHKPDDITIALIATRSEMTRTSVYAHFSSVQEILEQVSIRFVKQTGLFVERYVREHHPRSLADVATLIIRGIQEYFNQPHLHTPGALARHVPFQVRQIIRDFDKVAALPYHTLWHIGWPVDPLSEDDPFRVLVVLQSALFETSLERHGIITDHFAEEAINVAIDFLRRTEARFGGTPQEPSAVDRITRAAKRLAGSGNGALLEAAAGQIEMLVEATKKKPGQITRQRS